MINLLVWLLKIDVRRVGLCATCDHRRYIKQLTLVRWVSGAGSELFFKPCGVQIGQLVRFGFKTGWSLVEESIQSFSGS